MNNLLKSRKTYPAGTLILVKKYSLWNRFKHWICKKQRLYNGIKAIGSSRQLVVRNYDLIVNDYFLYIPKKRYTKKEEEKFHKLIHECETVNDYLTLVNIIRPDTVVVNGNLDQFKSNKYYTEVFLDGEKFDEVINHDK